MKGILKGIDDKEISFYLKDNYIEVIRDFDIDSIFGTDSVKFDKVYGRTSDNRDIIFLDSIYNKLNFSSVGWIVANNNLVESNIGYFDGITFTSKALDVFYSPKNSLQYENIDKQNISLRMSGIINKNFDEYTKTHNISINNEEINIILSVSTIYNHTRNERIIGEVTSTFTMKFNKRKPIEELTKYYLYLLDFLRFINFQKNIEFDNIFTLEKDKENKYFSVGKAYYKTKNYGEGYKTTEHGSITYKDISQYFESIFASVVSRRNRGILNDMFIPDNSKERIIVDHIRFLSIALNFEGEFNRKFTKYRKDEIKVKFNKALEYYDDILKSYVKNIIESENVLIKKDMNLGKAFANMRNSVAHGNPIPIKRLHVAIYRITLCLIYVMILSSSGMENDNITKVITKIL